MRFRYERGVGEDILFMFDAQRAGFEARVHGGVLCGHLPEWPLDVFRYARSKLGFGQSKPLGTVVEGYEK